MQKKDSPENGNVRYIDDVSEVFARARRAYHGARVPPLPGWLLEHEKALQCLQDHLSDDANINPPSEAEVLDAIKGASIHLLADSLRCSGLISEYLSEAAKKSKHPTVRKAAAEKLASAMDLLPKNDNDSCGPEPPPRF